MHIIIFGPPGVGKGTQAKIICKKLGVKHISTGDILRTAIKNETELGKKAKEIVDRGDLVPDDIMGAIIKDAIAEAEHHNGFILDGYPRTVGQAEILDDIFEEIGIDYAHLIKLQVDEDTIVERLSSRRMCSECHHIINISKLKEENKCPDCGAESTFIRREDDKPEVIKKRLRVYEESTAPVIHYYENGGKAKVIRINGDDEVKRVTNKILSEVGAEVSE